MGYQYLSNVIDDVIPYCIRPANRIDIISVEFVDTHGQNWSFEELRLANITTEQLLLWSAPINLAERYGLYMISLDSLLNERFYNCTHPWFGSLCQYSFELTDSMSIDEVVEATFNGRMPYDESSDIMAQLSCYTHISCDLGGSLLCLDWREVCDGRVDCLNGGLDETFCFEMEINECEDHEYRCHNGLCIPEEFWEDGLGSADCLDRSDESAVVKYPRSCFEDPTFRCEEHTCRTKWLGFACGDGECVRKFDQCQNGRHAVLRQSLSVQANLSDKCWVTMVCLTNLVKQINGDSCETWLINNSGSELLDNCEALFQFPSIPVHLGHIRFLYENTQIKLNDSRFFLPTYICYDHQLCDFLRPTFVHKNFSCLASNEFELPLDAFGDSWVHLFLWMNYYFGPCLTSPMNFDDTTKFRDHPSLHQCRNSSKFISINRILDRYTDCHLRDDENFTNSCSLKNSYRVKCHSGEMCLSASLNINDCPLSTYQHEKKMVFQQFCDGFVNHDFEISDEQNYTDESECAVNWPCDNLYSRCNNIWSCDDGRDEIYCHQSQCPLGTYMCISPSNFTLICLNLSSLADGKDDCLGGSDEHEICLSQYPESSDSTRFRCLDTEDCLPSFELCNGNPACPEHDDENFCTHHPLICDKNSSKIRSEEQDILCRYYVNNPKTTKHFSLGTSSNYPIEESTRIGEITQWESETHGVVNNIVSEYKVNSWPWECNRGLQARIWSSNDNFDLQCFCPPSYYGHLCQYQSERVSLTLGFVAGERSGAFTILTKLVNDDGEIDSFDQFVYTTGQSCWAKFNRYLLFSQRPKDFSKNYSVHIDVFSKNPLQHIGSWYVRIPFLFLPVNRLAVVLHLPSSSMPSSSSCLGECIHGVCVRYVNVEKYFCHCFPGWSGVQCDRPTNCPTCSRDSICLGQVNNRPICICPVTKSGPHCLLTSSCSGNECQNNGQCVPDQLATSNSSYVCICPSDYFGSRCQNTKGKLEVSLDNLMIPSYVLAFIFTISNVSEPRSTIMVQKLTLFQRLVIFRSSIPFHVVFLQADSKYYLAVVQQSARADISTSINPTRECLPIGELLNSTVMMMDRIQRVQFYHLPCQRNPRLICFFDEFYLCLCTNERHANCLNFDRDRKLQCSSEYQCANGGQCLQDHPICPSSIICVCTNCFFGNRCQFYAKGFGFTLDQILGYEIRRNVPFSRQPLSVKLSSAITMIMCVTGIINGLLTMFTFMNKTSQSVGCGIYLVASSITSLLVVVFFTVKFWFLIASAAQSSFQRTALYGNCMVIEPLLKAFLYMDNWLNSCVALERALTVYRGITFNKIQSRKIAKRVLTVVIVFTVVLLTPQLSQIHLFDDVKEERTWCVIHYSSALETYNSILILFHLLTPFCINLLSAIFVIVVTARQHEKVKKTGDYFQSFKHKFKQYNHLLVSPIILVFLAMPHLIISFTLDCHKSSRHFNYYLSGYFISFIPSVLVFVVFVLSSKVYRKDFHNAVQRLKRRYPLLRTYCCC